MRHDGRSSAQLVIMCSPGPMTWFSLLVCVEGRGVIAGGTTSCDAAMLRCYVPVPRLFRFTDDSKPDQEQNFNRLGNNSIFLILFLKIFPYKN